METFLNPNLAYLFLVGGFSLMILALMVPGTGMLELSAVFLLVLAGWEAFSLPINFWALGVLLVGVIPFALAVRRSRKLVYLAVSEVALVIGSVFMFREDVWWRPSVNLFLALFTSIIVGAYFWIAVTKILDTENIQLAHNLSQIIGMLGEAKTDVYFSGSVQVNGELWSARSQNPIPAGSVIRVIHREGFLLDVEAVE